jgi:hypothetical protein
MNQPQKSDETEVLALLRVPEDDGDLRRTNARQQRRLRREVLRTFTFQLNIRLEDSLRMV